MDIVKITQKKNYLNEPETIIEVDFNTLAIGVLLVALIRCAISKN